MKITSQLHSLSDFRLAPNLMTWTCCQIGAREHYAVARALHRHQALGLLLTDAWVNPGDMLGNFKRTSMRFHSDLAKAKVFAPNLANLVFEVRPNLAGLSGWSKVIARNDWFQKIAVTKLSQIKPIGESPVIMAYSYAALEIFKLARARGWRTVLGQIEIGRAHV